MADLAQGHVAVDGHLFLQDGAAQNGRELHLGHILHLAADVVGQRVADVGIFVAGRRHIDGGFQTDILAGSAHANHIVAAFHSPVTGGRIPVTESLVIQRDGNGLALPCLQRDTGKALELLHGSEDLGVRLGDVDLDDLIACAVAGIGDRQRNTGGRSVEILVFEGGVGQAVAEGHGHRHSRRLIVAVADIKALAVLDGTAGLAEVVVGGVVLTVQRPGLGQTAGGIHLAGQHIQHGTGACLAAQACPDQRLAMALPVGLNGAAAAQDHNEIGVGAMHRQQQIHLVLGQLHIAAVETLALLDLIQAEEQQDGFRLLGQLDGLGLQGSVRLAVTVKALCKADTLESALLEHLQEAVHLGSVDHAGASALIAGCLGKVTDDRNAVFGIQRQQAALVLEQDDAFRCCLAGQGMVGIPVNGLGSLFQCLAGGVHQV